MKTAGLILAGGQSGRFGGHKFLTELAGTPLLERVAVRLAPQVDVIAVNLPRGFLHQDFTVLHEQTAAADQAGPLAGVLVGLEWARSAKADALITMPVDVPFFPNNIVDVLAANIVGLSPACVVENGRRHGLCTLWPVACLPPFSSVFKEKGVRTVNQMLDLLDAKEVAFDLADGLKFFNINTIKDYEIAEQFIIESDSIGQG